MTDVNDSPTLRLMLALGILLSLIGLGRAQTPDARPTLAIGQQMPEFALNDFRGTPVQSDAFGNRSAIAVVFFGVECPIVKLSASRLEGLQKQHGKSLQLIGINANQQDSLSEMAVFAKNLGVSFPLLKDNGNRIADAFGAERTPEVFLFDQDRKLQYRGAIDDQFTYGQQRIRPNREFLADAIEAVLKGDQPEVQVTEPEGCIIGRMMQPKRDSKITYARQISRILNEHCVSCHRPGEIAPFSLTDYDEVVGWAEMIAEVTSERRMPPWHANPAHGEKFANDISLSDDQVKLIQGWVEAGAPQGDLAELPEKPKFAEGWQIGEPDLIVEMAKRPFAVPATGVVPYRYFEVDPGFEKDTWIQAAECRIGNRSVVHHIIVGLKDPDRGELNSHGQIDSEWLTATAPGSPPLQLEEGYAKLIPKGSILVFQMHYTPCGTPQEDLSSVGFKFADPETVRKSVGTREVANRRLRIPPGADNHEVTKSIRFDQDTLILSMFPHMHVRGKSFRYTATYPDGKTEILLDIPKYDFNWQNGYRFKKPKLMPAGTRLTCVAHYDNSTGNFSNPDPTKTVRWGDQTWDEMMIGYFDMALANQDLTQDEAAANPRTLTTMAKLKRGQSLVDGDLQRLAQAAMSSDKQMNRLGALLAKRIPQIDRVCVTRIKGDDLEVARVVQRADVESALGGAEVVTPAEGTRLAVIARGSQAVVFDDLSRHSAKDLEYMHAVMRSSFHIPVTVNGRRGTVNFWSKEPAAFPEPLQKLLISLAVAESDSR